MGVLSLKMTLIENKPNSTHTGNPFTEDLQSGGF